MSDRITTIYITGDIGPALVQHRMLPKIAKIIYFLPSSATLVITVRCSLRPVKYFSDKCHAE